MDLNNPNRLYIALGVSALLLGMWGWKEHTDTLISQADGQVKFLEDAQRKLKAERDHLDTQLSAANFRFDSAEREARRLMDEARKRPTPPKPPPAPKTAEELTLSMRVALSPESLVVEDPNRPSVLNVADGQKVFLYFEEAKRIPGFESKVIAQDAALTGLQTTLKAAGDRFGLQTEALSLAGTQLETSQKETQILKKEVSQVKTRGRLQKILWGAAGLGVGFLVGKH